MVTGEKTKRHVEIALVITELEVGGAERCLTNLALRLDRNRFRPQVYSLEARPAAGQSQLVDELEANHIPVKFLGAHSMRDAWTAYRRLRDSLRQQRPDIVQTFLFHANVLGALAAKAAGVPTIVLGVRVADPSVPRRTVERAISRLAKRIVCVSESVATSLRQSRFPDEKLIVIPNGIDLDRFLDQAPRGDPLRPPIGQGKQVMTVVGRLHPQKGIDWLLNSLPPFFQSHPNVDLAIVGRGPSESDLRQLAERLGIAERVHFLGQRDDVPAILRQSDLFVLPSRWEGMANAVLEAMASGLPVLATRVEGMAELLGPAADEQLVPPRDSQKLIDGIASIFSDPRRAKDLGHVNREQAGGFSLDRMVASYETLYLGERSGLGEG